MAKSVKGLLCTSPDLSDFSDTSDDSFDLYKNMQRIPNVPMPAFKKPLRKKNLFIRESPSVSRIRRSTFMNVLGNCKKPFASTPVNPGALVDSGENSVSKLSPIAGASSNVDTQSNLGKRHSQRSPGNSRSSLIQLERSHNASFKNQKKHVNSAVKAVADHLLKLSESIRMENGKVKSQEKKDKNKKNGSNVKSATSLGTKCQDQLSQKSISIRREKSKDSLKELSKLHRMSKENDLAGVAVLNYSTDEESVTNRKNCVRFSRFPNLTARKTILMERQTQTTDSLEKGAKKAIAELSPMKGVERETQTAKRKIIETEEQPDNARKRSKIEKGKEISVRTQKEQSNITSPDEDQGHELQNDAIKQKDSGQLEPRGNEPGGKSPDNALGAIADELLESFGLKVAASIISISSASETMINELCDGDSQYAGDTMTENEAGKISSEDAENSTDDQLNMAYAVGNSSEGTNQDKKKSNALDAVKDSSSIKENFRSIIDDSKKRDGACESAKQSKSMVKVNASEKYNRSINESANDLAEDTRKGVKLQMQKRTKPNPTQENQVFKVVSNPRSNAKSPANEKSNAVFKNTKTSKKADSSSVRNTSSKRITSADSLQNNKKSVNINSESSKAATGNRSLRISESETYQKNNTKCEKAEGNHNTNHKIQGMAKSNISQNKNLMESSMVLRSQASENSKSTFHQKSASNKILASNSVNKQKTVEDTRKVSERNSLPRKSGRLSGFKNKTMSVTGRESLSLNNKRPRGRPKGSKNKVKITADRLSGFHRIPSTRSRSDTTDGGEVKAKRQHKKPPIYIQSVFLEIPKKQTTSVPKKSIVFKNSTARKSTRPQKSSGQNYTAADSKVPNVVESPPPTHGTVSKITSKLESSTKGKKTSSDSYSFVGKRTNKKNNSPEKKNSTESISSKAMSPLPEEVVLDAEIPNVVKSFAQDDDISSCRTISEPGPSKVSQQTTFNMVSLKEIQGKEENETMESSAIQNTNVSVPEEASAFQTSSKSAKNQNIDTQTKRNSYSSLPGNTSEVVEISSIGGGQKNDAHIAHSCHSENVDSGVGSVMKEGSATAACSRPQAIIHENIQIQASYSAGSQLLKASKSFRKKSVTFTERPITNSQNNDPVSQTLSPLHTEIEDKSMDSPRYTLNESQSIHMNDDSSSALSSRRRTLRKRRSSVLYTVVNNEVVSLNWISKSQDFHLGTVNGMSVKYSLRNLKSSFGTQSNGYIILAPKYQKPWQISKTQCITFTVYKGQAVVKVHGKKRIVGVGCSFYIPLGSEYTIINKENEPLVLLFWKITR